MNNPLTTLEAGAEQPPRTYPYRTTTEQLEKATQKIASDGDHVVSSHFVGGRDWVLICRHGAASVAEMAPEDFEALLNRVAWRNRFAPGGMVERGDRRGTAAGR